MFFCSSLMSVCSLAAELCFHFGSARTVCSSDIGFLLGFSLYLLFIFEISSIISSLLYIQVSQVESLYSLCPHDGGQDAAGLYAQLAG